MLSHRHGPHILEHLSVGLVLNPLFGCVDRTAVRATN